MATTRAASRAQGKLAGAYLSLWDRYEKACFACSGPVTTQHIFPSGRSLSKCLFCGGIQGIVTPAEAATVVDLTSLVSDPAPQTYFDLALTDGTALTGGTHGWFNQQTKQVTQYG